MKTLSQIISTLILITISFSAFSTIHTSATSGSWSVGGTWDTGVVPGCGDTIVIQAGHTVTIPSVVDYSACTEPMYVEVYGVLNFSGGGSKLRLPDDSGVQLHVGGEFTAPGGGGGSSRTLEIGSDVVWSKGTGPVSGPLAYGSPLPVELLAFEAVFNEDRVDIYWSTASELNSSHFVVERSKDGSVWDEVLYVEAAGNSNTIIEYFDFDDEPLYGVSYYRLVQYDNDGEYEVFHVVPVENIEGGAIAFDIFPNPTTQDNINLSFKGFEGKEVLVVLRDVTGKEYYSKVEIVNTDQEIIAYSPDLTLPKGVYLITASSENELYSQKVIIQ